MQQLLRKLSHQDQKLYSIIILACTLAFVLGLLAGFINLNSNKTDKTDNWQPTHLPAPPDAATEFSTVTTNSRWFREKGVVSPTQAAEEAKKAIEGQPESLKLIGIVDRKGQIYALFLPANGGKSVSQFAAGDTLVGDWKVKGISASKVTVESRKDGAETQTKELLLYSAKK